MSHVTSATSHTLRLAIGLVFSEAEKVETADINFRSFNNNKTPLITFLYYTKCFHSTRLLSPHRKPIRLKQQQFYPYFRDQETGVQRDGSYSPKFKHRLSIFFPLYQGWQTPDFLHHSLPSTDITNQSQHSCPG